MSSHNFKIVLLGQGCVGKTSLVLRYVSNVFDDAHQSTLQASFLKKQLYLEQDLIRLNIWDTAGQEKFHALGPIYYRGANGAALVYDVTNPASLMKVRDWVKELNKMLGSDNIKLAIIGNKLDLLPPAEQKSAQSNLLVQEALELTSELMNAKHYLTSAKLNQGIGEMFGSLSRRMMEHSRRQMAAKASVSSLQSIKSQRSLALASEDEDDNYNNNYLDKSKMGSPNKRLKLGANRQADGGTSQESCQC